MADTLLEHVLLGSAVVSMISDVAGISGGGFSFALPLFALIAVWAANPRGLLVYILANGLSIVFDVGFLAAQAAGGAGGARPAAAVAFYAINVVIKAAVTWFAHVEFLKLGGAYSRACPTVSSAVGGGGATSVALSADSNYDKFGAGGEEPSSYNAGESFETGGRAAPAPAPMSSGGYQ